MIQGRVFYNSWMLELGAWIDVLIFFNYQRYLFEYNDCLLTIMVCIRP